MDADPSPPFAEGGIVKARPGGLLARIGEAGHDEAVIDAAYTRMKQSLNGKPKAIVANSVKGKGVSFMEHNNIWHYTRLNAETHAAAVSELGDTA